MSAGSRIIAAAAVTAALAGCGTSGHPVAADPTPAPTPSRPAPAVTPSTHREVQARPVVHLTTYSDCDDLVGSLRQQALKDVRAYAQRAVAPYAVADSAVGTTAGAGVASTSGAAAAPKEAAVGSDFSGTNNQEAGVDEPDVVKTDGRLLVVARGNRPGVQVLRVDGDQPRAESFLALPDLSDRPELFLLGSTVVAVAPKVWVKNETAPVTVAHVVDVSDPAAPHLLRTFRVPGSEVDARSVGGRVVLVQQGEPTLRLRSPVQPGATESQVESQTRRALEQTTVDDWLPPVTVTPSRRTFHPNCTTTWHDAAHKDTGTSTISVVTFDPSREDSVTQTTVVGAAGTVYASTKQLYVASSPMWLWPRGFTGMGIAADAVGAAGPDVAMGVMPIAGDGVTGSTQIDGFDLTDPTAAHYLGSGVVAGNLTDQYAMSEQDGYLRVATTVGTPIPAPNEGQAPKVLSDSRVTVLHPSGRALVAVGSVRGLGRGEKIYGVRFLGDLGYVVTFRQIDPLYVIDLADPRHPREVSHLKVTGYSAYLHPLGDGLLFGLGKQVDSQAHPIGEQLSVFDVSTPSRPSLRDRVRLPNTESAAEYDHHAFLWWPKDRLVVFPLSSYETAGQRLAVYRVGTDGSISSVGSVAPPMSGQADYAVPERAVVVGDVLYTVTSSGVLANRLHGLGRVAWLPFH